MKTRLWMTTAAFALVGSMAHAVTATDVAKDFKDQGYTNIEVTQGLNQIKVEASNGNGSDKVEVIIDAESGDVIKTETYSGEGGEVDEGIEINNAAKDFVDGDDDDDEDDEDEDDEDDEDDDEDDDDGDDDDGDDDSDDDGDDDDGDDGDDD